jgi:SPP1 gp7 family putative phage head morphogenesis protein
MTSVIDLAAQYRAELLAKDAAAMGRLVNAYRVAYTSLLDKLELLMMDIGTSIPTPGQIARMERYKALMAQAAMQLRDLEAITRQELDAAVKLGIDLGGTHARGLIAATMADERLAAVFNRLPNEAIKQLLGFLSPDGELYQRLGRMSEYGADRLAQELIRGITLGYNPTKIAGVFRREFGATLTDALRTVRTAQLWSYREANRATYLANSDVVEGWVWYAELDDRVCASCVAMHGSIHPNTETLNDHYNGRCAMIPVVKGMPPIVTETGKEWFDKQDEATQKRLLGPGKFDAFSEGKFEFSALSTQADDPVYGTMRVETTLKDLIGE